MESRTMPPPQASARQTEMGETFNRVLFTALDALHESGIPYALIGGIAASGMGRPRSTHDIDIFVRPEDAEAALEALGGRGFDTDRTDPRWLFKGWKDEMMVDIIFKSSGDIYFDNEMYSRAKPISYHGRNIPAVAPEDLIVIKAAVHSEIGPHHWHDALALLSHANIDWEYLTKRARKAAKRILALLIYAQSNDIWIPNQVISDLYGCIFGTQIPAATGQQIFGFNDPVAQPPTIGTAGGGLARSSSKQPLNTPVMEAAAPAVVPVFSSAASSAAPSATIAAPRAEQKASDKPMPESYLRGHLQDELAQKLGTAALDVQFVIGSNRILVQGECPSLDHRSDIETVVRQMANVYAGGYVIENQIRVTEIRDPEVAEVV